MSTKVNVPVPEFDGSTDASKDSELKRLRSTHELWNRYANLWTFYLSAYEGGESFTTQSNLFKHQRENKEDFNDRAKRLHNLNYCEPLVDFFTNFIFSESIDRDGNQENEMYQAFIEDVNKKGDSVDDFMRQVCDDMQIFGMSYILVDMPPVDPGLTKQDEQDAGLRPYWVLVKPEEILDWVVDEFGNYQYAKRKQYLTVIKGRSRVLIERYTEFYPEAFVVTDVDVSDPSKPIIFPGVEYPNTVGRIPLVVARYKRSKEHPYVGLSFLRDFAYNQREIMNLTSLLQEFLYRQAFNILAMETDEGSVPVEGEAEGMIGTANVMKVPRGAEMPRYISPPADPARFIQDERGRIKNEMFVRAAQDALSELFNGEKASGFSQAQSFSKTVPFIASRADVLEHVEHELMTLTMKFISREWTGKIKYKDNYSITNLTDGITQFLMLVKDLQLPSETFVKEELKRMINEFDGKLTEDVRRKIYTDIDEMDFTKWAKVQKEALVGKQATSPGEQQKPKSTGTMMEASAEATQVNTAATKKLKTK